MRTYYLVAFLGLAACGDVVAKGPSCESSAECTDPAAPFCVNAQCQAACSGPVDCVDPERGVCASDGACVGCVMNTDCDAAAPICDTGERACRGCEMDSECPGGVCIEAAGTCAPDSDVAFVTMMGTDAGTCSRTAPCATIPFAISVSGSRKIVHVLGGSLNTSTLTLSSDRTLDGEDTTLTGGSTTSTLVVQAPASVTVEGFRISTPTMAGVAGISLNGAARARLYNLKLTGSGGLAIAAASGSTLLLSHSHVGDIGIPRTHSINLSSATAVIEENVFEMTILGGTGSLTASRNRFESSADGSIQFGNGLLVAENNLIIHRDGFNDSMLLNDLRAGSAVRFNTFINTTAVGSDGAALSCAGAGVSITSNIFAYNSGNPITGTCETRYSVFDDRALTAAGTGNQKVGIETIFVNRLGGDYHLSATSAAKGNAEPGLNMVKVDFEGKPRPNPAGGPADSGAFEAP